MSTSGKVRDDEKGQTKPRHVEIDREQLYWSAVDVEALVGPKHRVRAIRELAGRLDFSEWESRVAAREGAAGRPCFSPQLLACVWIYGYSIGVASARALARMVEWEPGLRWLTGCGSINAHTLSDFRVDDKQRLDGLFANLVAVLRREGLIDLKVVTQDGTKVKAKAGKQSMHRRVTLEAELDQARRHMEHLDQQARADEAQDERRLAAQKRVARERATRLENALEELQKREEEKPPSQRDQVRVSDSEAEARKMKHADGS